MMGFLSALKRTPLKLRFVRQLAKARLSRVPELRGAGLVESAQRGVDGLSMPALLGLPEATVFTILESWADRAPRTRVDELAVLVSMENHRGQAGGDLAQMGLFDFLVYRCDVEGVMAAPGADPSWLEMAFETACRLLHLDPHEALRSPQDARHDEELADALRQFRQ